MSISARKLIQGQTKVHVTNVHQVSPTLCVVSYERPNADGRMEHVDDLYNVPNSEVMDVLMTVQAGKKVEATLEPDGPDADQHPEISAAVEVE